MRANGIPTEKVTFKHESDNEKVTIKSKFKSPDISNIQHTKKEKKDVIESEENTIGTHIMQGKYNGRSGTCPANIFI